MSGPSFPIQSPAPGFLGLQQLKNLGQQPDTLLGEVRPNVSIEGYWLRGQRQQYPLRVERSVVGFQQDIVYSFSVSAPITVPQGQWWYVHNCTAVVGLPAGATACGIGLGYYQLPALLPGGFVRNYVLAELVGTTQVNAVGVAVWRTASFRDAWIPPGAEISMYLGYLDSGTTVRLNGLDYTPVPI